MRVTSMTPRNEVIGVTKECSSLVHKSVKRTKMSLLVKNHSGSILEPFFSYLVMNEITQKQDTEALSYTKLNLHTDCSP